MKNRRSVCLLVSALLVIVSVGCTPAAPTTSTTPLTTTTPSVHNPLSSIPDEYIDQPILSVENHTIFYKPIVAFSEYDAVVATEHLTVKIDDPQKTEYPDYSVGGLDENRNLYLFKNAPVSMGDKAAPEIHPYELGSLNMKTGKYQVLRSFETDNARFCVNNDAYVVWAEFNGTSTPSPADPVIHVYSIRDKSSDSFPLPKPEKGDTSPLMGSAGFVLHKDHLYYEVADEVSSLGIRRIGLYDYDIAAKTNQRIAMDAHTPFVSNDELCYIRNNPGDGLPEAVTLSGRQVFKLAQSRFTESRFQHAFTGGFIAQTVLIDDSGQAIPDSLSVYKDETGLKGAGLSVTTDGSEYTPLLATWNNSRIFGLLANRHVVPFLVTDLDATLLYDVASDRIVRLDKTEVRGVPAITEHGMAFWCMTSEKTGDVFDIDYFDMDWPD